MDWNFKQMVEKSENQKDTSFDENLKNLHNISTEMEI